MIELETLPDGKPDLDLGERQLVLGMFTPDNPHAPDNVARVKLLGGYDVRYGLHKGMKWREVPRDWLYGFALNDDQAIEQVSRCILRAAVLEYLDRPRELVVPERLCKPKRRWLAMREAEDARTTPTDQATVGGNPWGPQSVRYHPRKPRTW